MQGPSRVAVALLVVVAATTVGVSVTQTDGAVPSVGDAAPVPPGADGSSIWDPADAPAARQSAVVQPVVREENTTSRLVLITDRLQTVRFGTVRLDVGGAMAVDNAELHGEYALQSLHHAFDAADGDTTARRIAVNRSADQLDARIADLVEREREALRAYNRGDLSTAGYLRELAAIDAAARSLETSLEQLHTYNRAAGEPVPTTRIARMKAQLVPLTGPVRSTVADAMTGDDGSAVRVYVETSPSGFVLSMLDDRRFTTQYVREAYHGDSFDGQWTDNPITHDEFESRVADQYPWVWDTNSQLNTVLTGEPYYYRAGIYSIAVNHPQGTDTNRDLEVYYDAGTQNVFFEAQRLGPARLPTAHRTNATAEGLAIELQVSYASGPTKITVTDAVTGEPVDARVSLNGAPIGSTTDGHLWTIAPRGSFAVTASQGGRNVTASTRVSDRTAGTPTPLPDPVEE